MLITLKQKEIETALRLYISQRGINLAGKEVVIAFTAGRKESGVSAEVNIEDLTNPCMEIGVVVAGQSAAQAFNDMLLGGAGITVTSVDPASIYLDAAPTAEPEQAPAPPPVLEAGKKSVSLFN